MFHLFLGNSFESDGRGPRSSEQIRKSEQAKVSNLLFLTIDI
jgi:hypothetical protein